MLRIIQCVQKTVPVFNKFTNGAMVRTSYAYYCTDKPPLAPDNNRLSISKKVKFNENKLDEAAKRKLYEIKVELHEMFESGDRVCDPEIVSPEQWEYILSLKTRTARVKQYQFIGMKNYLKQKDKKIKEQRKIDGIEHRKIVIEKRQNENHIIYGLGHTSLFLRINREAIIKSRNARLWRAKMFKDPKLVFDFSYDDSMTMKFCRYTAKHVMHAFGDNRKNQIPFDMHICNGNMESNSMQHLKQLIPNLTEESCPLTVHQESYLDLYPKDRLLYITPYSPNVMRDYNPNDILIIPAIIDYGYHGSVTMANAKKLGIRTVWLPVERYMYLGAGVRSLPLNIISDILLDYKNTHDWKKALVHLPQRRVVQPRHARHMLSKVIDDISNTKGEMPRYSNSRIITEPNVKRFIRPNLSFNVRDARNDSGATDGSKKSNIKDLKSNPFK